jgi:aldose 1-epimerase
MDILTLTDPASGSFAQIAVDRGFNCFAFRVRQGHESVDVVDADEGFARGEGKPSGHGIPLLFPFPNRIRDGRFQWDGREFDLTAAGNVARDANGHAIHGFCLDRPWRVTQRGENFAVGEFRLSVDAADRRPLWPTDCRIEVRYTVTGAALRAEVTVSNPDDQPMPWGFGTHPYFKLPLSAESNPDRCLVQAPATELWELGDCLPTGKRIPVPEDKDLRDGAYFDVLKLDDVYTGLPVGTEPHECRIVDEQAGRQVVQRCDPQFRELVVYTPANRSAVCLEPYTCVTDAVHLEPNGVDAGWRTLQPHGAFHTWIEIALGPVIA